jgi:predicted nucleic acid-binding protein
LIYLFDTSSIIALFDNEEGAAKVQKYFSEVDSNAAEGYISAVTVAELYGAYGRVDGEPAAINRILKLKESGIGVLIADEDIAMAAGKMKLRGVPTADALIAATAKAIGARLIAADKHFEDTGADLIKFR